MQKRLRLIGVGASHFVPAAAPVQAELFPEERRKAPDWEKVDHTLDAIHAKFGRGAIRKASLVDTRADTPGNHPNRRE